MIHGFVEGRAKNAARDKVEGFDVFSDNNWVEKQIDYMTRISENVGDSVACQESLTNYGRLSRKLPIALLNRKESSLEDLIIAIGKRGRVTLSLSLDDEESEDDPVFYAKEVDSVSPFIGKYVDEDRLFFLVDMPDGVTCDNLEKFISDGIGPLAQVLKEVKDCLGPTSEIRSNLVDSDYYRRSQTLNIEIRRVSDLTH